MKAAPAKTTTKTARTTAKATKTTKTAKKPAKAAATDGKTLVVVESPAKAKTIEKYLGPRYTVRASMGHIRDLPKSQFGIDVEHDFAPKYINIRGKGDIINDLKKAAKAADKIYLASDPDREGEAIAWHLAHILDISPESDCRIVFNEITKPAILAAVKEPRPIAHDRVDAQQARRLLDRIVGYQLSPLLWRKVQKGLSAGRVQSVAAKLIVDRENLIDAFQSQEYWTIDLKLRQGKSPLFTAALVAIGKKRLDEKKGDKWQPAIPDEKTASAIVKEIEKNAASLIVKEVKKSEALRRPAPPFNTSSLQQDAARKLGFTSRKTMLIAQQLYEGIRLGQGPVGLITYMRTDSARLSDTAVAASRSYIADNFGKPYLPAKPNIYTTSKNAQDAHEAIRPTDVNNVPENIAQYLTGDQLKLYRLIWQRFVACQMTPAVYDRLAVTIIEGEKFTFRASGSAMKFQGFTAVYAGAEEKTEKDIKLPPLAAGDNLNLHKAEPLQHFTEPPPRYNEASLVKEMEVLGIGRPSTYAPTIETIINRGYVIRSEKHFQPTELGKLVVAMLEEYFQRIVDAKFTADLEKELDDIAEGKLTSTALLNKFYVPFHQTVEEADKAIGAVNIAPEETDVICEKCGRNMVIRQSRFGKFLACPGFPECRNAKPLQNPTGCACPQCGSEIYEKKSPRGKIFYGCEKYPACDFSTWDKPIEKKCPSCGGLMLRHRYSHGGFIDYCYNAACPTRENNRINDVLNKKKARATAAVKKAAMKTTKTKVAAEKKVTAKSKATTKTKRKAK